MVHKHAKTPNAFEQNVIGIAQKPSSSTTNLKNDNRRKITSANVKMIPTIKADNVQRTNKVLSKVIKLAVEVYENGVHYHPDFWHACEPGQSEEVTKVISRRLRKPDSTA